MKKRGRPAFEFRHVAASVDARGHVAAMCFEFSLSLPCIRPWRRHVSSPPTVKLYWCTRRAHGGVVRVAPERLPAPARHYSTSSTLILRLGVCFHCGRYLRARLLLIFTCGHRITHRPDSCQVVALHEARPATISAGKMSRQGATRPLNVHVSRAGVGAHVGVCRRPPRAPNLPLGSLLVNEFDWHLQLCGI